MSFSIFFVQVQVLLQVQGAWVPVYYFTQHPEQQTLCDVQ